MTLAPPQQNSLFRGVIHKNGVDNRFLASGDQSISHSNRDGCRNHFSSCSETALLFIAFLSNYAIAVCRHNQGCISALFRQITLESQFRNLSF